MENMLYSVILQKIVARKVSSYVALRNCSKVIREARVQKVTGWKKNSESIKRLLWMMDMLHLKLMVFMLLNNRYLFIFIILFICLLILAVLGLFCWLSADFSGCGEQGLLSSWNVLTSPFAGVSSQSVGSGDGHQWSWPPGSSRVLSSHGAWA